MKRDIFAEIKEGFDALAEQRQEGLRLRSGCRTDFSREEASESAKSSLSEKTPLQPKPPSPNNA